MSTGRYSRFGIFAFPNVDSYFVIVKFTLLNCYCFVPIHNYSTAFHSANWNVKHEVGRHRSSISLVRRVQGADCCMYHLCDLSGICSTKSNHISQVEMGSKNHEVVPTVLIVQISGLRSGGVNKLLGELAKRNLVAKVRNAKCESVLALRHGI